MLRRLAGAALALSMFAALLPRALAADAGSPKTAPTQEGFKTLVAALSGFICRLADCGVLA